MRNLSKALCIVIGIAGSMCSTAGAQPCSEADALAEARRVVAIAQGKSAESISVEIMKSSDGRMVIETDEKLGEVASIRFEKGTIELALRTCTVEKYFAPHCRPPVFARRIMRDGIEVLLSDEEIEARYVEVPEQNAREIADGIAVAMFGFEKTAEMALTEGGLRRDGGSLSYQYRWNEDIQDRGVRIGYRFVTVTINPETGCVYRIWKRESVPSDNGIIEVATARSIAENHLQATYGPGACRITRSTLGEGFSGNDNGGSRRFWSFIYECQGVDGIGKQKRWVKVDGESGEILECSSPNLGQRP